MKLERTIGTLGIVAAAAALFSCSRSPGPAGPHFGTFCIQQQKWPDLVARMRKYGVAHTLSFHGEITDTPSGPVFNYYLAQGYSYYFGDDLDLWITSDPFRPGQMDLNGVVKRKPATPEQMKLGRGLIAAIEDLSSCGVAAAE